MQLRIFSVAQSGTKTMVQKHFFNYIMV